MSRRLVFLAAFLLSLTFAASAAIAQDDAGYDPLLSELDVRSTLRPREAKLGQEMRWTIDVTHPTTGSVGFADEYTGGTLAVKDRRILRQSDDRTRVELVLSGFDLGETRVPPLSLRYTDVEGEDHPFNVLGGKVEIVGSGEEPAQQPADLVEPVGIYRTNWWFVGGVAAFLLAIAGFIVWWRRRPPPPPPAPPVDRRTPGQRALDAIFRLQTSKMLERREIKPFTYALDDVVRTFLIETYGRGELADTTAEFLAALQPVMPRRFMEAAEAFFAGGDRVRFAGEEHEVEEAKRLTQEAIDFVNAVQASGRSSEGNPPGGGAS